MKKLYSVISTLNVNTGKDLPAWYLIFEEGWNELEGQGKYLVDAKAWDLVNAWISRRGLEIVFDYEHQSVKGVQAPAAGWGKEWRYTKGLGIEAKIDWNEEAASYLSKGEYRYYSPVFYVNKSDHRLAGVHSVALTNTPKTNHLKPLLAKLGEQQQEENNMLEKLITLLSLSEGATEDDVMAAVDNLNNPANGEQVPEQVIACLNLKGTDNLSTVVASIEAMSEQVPGLVISALDLQDTDDLSTVVASIEALKQAPKGMVSRVEHEALVLKIAKKDAGEAVAAASLAGKITPDQNDWATKYAERDLSGFNTFVAKAPVVIPVGKLPGASEKQDQVNLDETTKHVASLMGVTQEDLEQFGPKQ